MQLKSYLRPAVHNHALVEKSFIGKTLIPLKTKV